MLAALVAMLILTAGCLNVLGDSETTPLQKSPERPTQPSSTVTFTETETTTPTATSTPVDEATKNVLEEFARKQERAFIEGTNLTNVNIEREEGTVNLIVSFGLPDTGTDIREAAFEHALETLVHSHYNFDTGSDVYSPDKITVTTDYGTANASRELLDLYVDGKLEQVTVAYIWAGKFDPYSPLGDVDNSSHATREERLEHTADRVERRLQSNASYVRNPEVEIQDETLYVAYENTDDSPNPAFPQNQTAYVYYQVITQHGIDYMPYNGMRAYHYRQNGTARVTWYLKNSWVVSEHVGLRGTGELALNSLNTFQEMEGPHEGPP